MIFLGAGASFPFGVPTMNGFTDSIIDSLSAINSEWKQRLVEMKDNLQSKGLRYDVEILSTSISIFSEPSNTNYITPLWHFQMKILLVIISLPLKIC
jgi:hypothetical protein